MQAEVALCVHMCAAAVSYPGVGRFRRAGTGILGVEQRGPGWAPYFLSLRFRLSSADYSCDAYATMRVAGLHWLLVLIACGLMRASGPGVPDYGLRINAACDSARCSPGRGPHP